MKRLYEGFSFSGKGLEVSIFSGFNGFGPVRLGDILWVAIVCGVAGLEKECSMCCGLSW